jgi:hypothetical protein
MNRIRMFEPKVLSEVRKLPGLRAPALARKPAGVAAASIRISAVRAEIAQAEKKAS